MCIEAMNAFDFHTILGFTVQPGTVGIAARPLQSISAMTLGSVGTPAWQVIVLMQNGHLAVWWFNDTGKLVVI
jgi:hypothetical protein